MNKSRIKKSTVFLILALTLPAGIALAGLAGGIRLAAIGTPGLNEREFESDRLGSLFGGGGSAGSGTLVTLKEGTLTIDRALSVVVDGGELELTFDPALKGEARLVLSGTKEPEIKVTTDPGRLAFAPPANAKTRFKVTLALPVALDRLDIASRAGRCDADAEGPVSIGALSLDVEAGTCDFEFDSLRVDTFTLKAQAGKSDFQADRLVAKKATLDLASGSLTFAVKELGFATPDKESGLVVKVATGNADLRVDSIAAHSLTVRSRTAALDLRRAGTSLRTRGLPLERRFAERDGAPEVELHVDAGKVDARFDTVAPPLLDRTL